MVKNKHLAQKQTDVLTFTSTDCKSGVAWRGEGKRSQTGQKEGIDEGNEMQWLERSLVKEG